MARAEISYSAGSLSVQDALGNEVSGQLPDLDPGDYDWEVVDGDCRESGSFTINAPGLPVVSISPAGPFNLSDGVQQLSASPPGGVWTGTNSAGMFDPSQGVGSYEVSYRYTDPNGCSDLATTTIQVIDPNAGCSELTNLALNKAATQSSTSYGADASRAADGNLNGNFDGGSTSVTHTLRDAQAWWEVDLGSLGVIEEVKVYNRTDCCEDRITNFYVLVSAVPFESQELNASLSQSGVLSYQVPGQAGFPETISIGGEQARYVRVQLAGTNYLSLTEVEVMGCEYVNSCTNPPVVSLNIEDASTCDGQGRAEISYSAGSLSVQDALGNEVSGQLPDLYPGDYDWEVVDGDCRESGSFTINAPGLPVVSISPAGPFNLSDGVQQLSASPPGGVWTGTNSAGMFDPSQGVGSYEVSYRYTDPNGCSDLATTTIQVIDPNAGCSELTNLALNKAATQSSTSYGADASRAADGNLNGNFDGGSTSVTHTLRDAQAWWEVDLGSLGVIEEVKVYNRTDCCEDRITNFYVLVSAVPFESQELNASLSQSGVLSYQVPGQAGFPETISIGGEQARYVRVQLAGTNYLSLTEVEVMGCEYVNSCTNPPVVSLNIEDATTCDGQGRAEISYSAGSLSVQDALGNEVSGQLPDLDPGDYDWEVVDGDCRESGSFTINAPGLPVVSISPAGPFNLSDGVQQLSASPPGGVWTGANGCGDV